ncbi:hypothetical protein [Streptomyces sp. NPDC056707]|uniref:hypothetical protein n=1 Tax=Streptomyces sp. NPDC056707 TaxID=3345919 RepID=UPI0036C6C299
MVEDGTRDEIEQLGVGDISPGLSNLAIQLAQAIDESDAPTAIAVAARELRATMQELRKLAPVRTEGDVLDDLADRRAKRLGA